MTRENTKYIYTYIRAALWIHTDAILTPHISWYLTKVINTIMYDTKIIQIRKKN